MDAISEILFNWENLSIDDKEYTLEILNNEVNERKREQLINRINEAEKNFNAGNVHKGGIEDLFGEIQNG